VGWRTFSQTSDGESPTPQCSAAAWGCRADHAEGSTPGVARPSPSPARSAEAPSWCFPWPLTRRKMATGDKVEKRAEIGVWSPLRALASSQDPAGRSAAADTQSDVSHSLRESFASHAHMAAQIVEFSQAVRSQWYGIIVAWLCSKLLCTAVHLYMYEATTGSITVQSYVTCAALQSGTDLLQRGSKSCSKWIFCQKVLVTKILCFSSPFGSPAAVHGV
jgi:hypothetical protein